MLNEKITPEKDYNQFINTFLEWFYSKIILTLLEAEKKDNITIDINWHNLYTTDEIKAELRKNVPMEISDEEMEKALHHFTHTIVISAIKKRFENTNTAKDILDVLTQEMTRTAAQWIYDETNNNENINSYSIETSFIYYPIENDRAYIDGVRFHITGSNEE